MRSGCKKMALMAACAALAGLGALRTSSASTITIDGGTSQVVDGWNITPQAGVTLFVTAGSDSVPIAIEKSAQFTAPNQGFLISFQPVAGQTPASVIDFDSETIQNSTGTTWSQFQFLLGAGATFPTVTSTFAPPSGFFSQEELNAAGDTLTYFDGSQATGTTSSWGSGIVDYDNTGTALPGHNSPDNLIIDASGVGFDLKEIPSTSGGGGGGGNVVPLPNAAWQSLVGLSALALFGLGRKLTKPA
jgi:hypothetical protein